MSNPTDLSFVKEKQNAFLAIPGVRASANCILALVSFFLADPVLRTVIVTFLQTLLTEIALQKAALQLIVAQSTVALALINSEIQAILAIFSVADGLGNRFPLDKLMGCPIISEPVNYVKEGLSRLGSGAGFPNPIQQAKTAFRDLQYKEALLQQKINKLNTAIGQLDLFGTQIQALIDFINAVASFPGPITLPIP